MTFDGVGLAEEIRRGLLESGKLVGKRLVVFQTGDRESVYVRLKRKMGDSLGVKVEVKIINDLEKLKKEILKVGKDSEVNGVLVQLPIVGASETERDEILRLIPEDKDVDGLNPDGGKFLPAVVVAVEKTLEKFEVCKLKIGVVGAKGIVGRGLMRRFEDDLGLVVEGFDMGDDLDELKRCDVVISATGQVSLIKPDMVKDGVIAIDLGYPKPDFEEGVKEKAEFFTPVPGGVGPVTVVSLFENLAKTG